MIFDRKSTPGGHDEELFHALRRAGRSLGTPQGLDPLIDAVGDARFVLLGEATHGTSEFYSWRCEISKRLIREKGFNFIAVEGDWPDCYQVNRYIKHLPDTPERADQVLRAFSRWPTWMWANENAVELVEWLRAHNALIPETLQVGFYGLDVYSLWESMAAVVEYLEGVDPAAAHAARRAYSCFDPYHDDAQAYAQATAFVPTSCEDATVAMLQKLRQQAATFEEDGRDSYFSAEQNALVARNAERYYRAMIRGGSSSWNVRDTHMLETLDRLVTHHAPRPKAIVWAHNTHIGDARFTDMARHGMVNLGQLVRQARGDGPDDRDGVMLVGFGTHRGSVIASEEWGAPMQRLPVPPARDGSWEDLLHQSSEGDRLFVFDGSDDGGIPGLGQAVDHRAVGVVYHPDAERWGNYVPSIIPRRYDAFMFIDESRALEPLHMPAILGADMPETYPTGM